MTDHTLGLLLGNEFDWPAAYEAVIERFAPRIRIDGEEHTFRTERILNEPYDLRAESRFSLVIDRNKHWYNLPREWLKKVALLDRTYLLNNPFTFQSMEKHAAYCAMIRLGLKVPATWMIPHKVPPENERFPTTAEHYNPPFDLAEVGEQVGYPLFMKPFDGGAWVGVSKIHGPDELRAAYDQSGERLMHLQRSVEPYEVFARSLSIGAETIVMHFDPGAPLHARYVVDHDFLAPEIGRECEIIGRTINAFFRWEFNSCETLIQGSEVSPIDFANANPDIAVNSLHYYFPWAVLSLVKWSLFTVATGRPMRINLDLRRWFDIGDDPELSYHDKLDRYAELADEHFEVDRYREFCDAHLGGLDEAMVEYVESSSFDDVLVDTCRRAYPAGEQDEFIDHFRGLVGAWAHGERARQG